MTRPSADTARARHSIAVVARQTGLTQLVLRAWERRYGAVEPARTPTGRRLYTDDDIRKLRLLRTLTEAGHRIGDVANLPVTELEELAVAADAAPPPAPRPGAADAQPDRLLGEALQAVADLDGAALERVLQQGAVALSRPRLREELLVPLLGEIGERWRSGVLRIGHEHLATAIVRTFLAGLRAGQAPAGARTLAVATPSGQRHELGALMAACQAEELGWGVLYLGPDLPAEEIAAAALERRTEAVLLSLVYPEGDPHVADQLRVLRRALGPGIALIVGGAAAASYGDALNDAGAVLVADGDALDRQLRALS